MCSLADQKTSRAALQLLRISFTRFSCFFLSCGPQRVCVEVRRLKTWGQRRRAICFTPPQYVPTLMCMCGTCAQYVLTLIKFEVRVVGVGKPFFQGLWRWVCSHPTPNTPPSHPAPTPLCKRAPCRSLDGTPPLQALGLEHPPTHILNLEAPKQGPRLLCVAAAVALRALKLMGPCLLCAVLRPQDRPDGGEKGHSPRLQEAPAMTVHEQRWASPRPAPPPFQRVKDQRRQLLFFPFCIKDRPQGLLQSLSIAVSVPPTAVGYPPTVELGLTDASSLYSLFLFFGLPPPPLPPPLCPVPLVPLPLSSTSAWVSSRSHKETG